MVVDRTAALPSGVLTLARLPVEPVAFAAELLEPDVFLCFSPSPSPKAGGRNTLQTHGRTRRETSTRSQTRSTRSRSSRPRSSSAGVRSAALCTARGPRATHGEGAQTDAEAAEAQKARRATMRLQVATAGTPWMSTHHRMDAVDGRHPLSFRVEAQYAGSCAVTDEVQAYLVGPERAGIRRAFDLGREVSKDGVIYEARRKSICNTDERFGRGEMVGR